MRGTDNWSWGAARVHSRCYVQFAIYQSISRLFSLTRWCKSQRSVLSGENASHRNSCKMQRTLHWLLNEAWFAAYSASTRSVWLYIPRKNDHAAWLSTVQPILSAECQCKGSARKSLELDSSTHLCSHTLYSQTTFPDHQPLKATEVGAPASFSPGSKPDCDSTKHCAWTL